MENNQQTTKLEFEKDGKKYILELPMETSYGQAVDVCLGFLHGVCEMAKKASLETAKERGENDVSQEPG